MTNTADKHDAPHRNAEADDNHHTAVAARRSSEPHQDEHKGRDADHYGDDGVVDLQQHRVNSPPCNHETGHGFERPNAAMGRHRPVVDGKVRFSLP